MIPCSAQRDPKEVILQLQKTHAFSMSDMADLEKGTTIGTRALLFVAVNWKLFWATDSIETCFGYP